MLVNNRIGNIKNYAILGSVFILIILSLSIAEFRGKWKKASQATQALLIKNDSIIAHLHTIDSLFLLGNYQKALNYYSQFLDPTLQNDSVLLLRSDLAYLMSQKQKRRSVDTVFVTKYAENIASPEEIRLYDSVQFALEKAKTQVENIKRQLATKSFGQYLTFKSGKGNEVHYVGQVTNKKANGKGIGLYKTGSRYQGDWKANKKHGAGTFFWPDGTTYEGEYLKDKRDGKGTYTWPNGDLYIGEWHQDKRNGFGTFYNKNREIVAKGIWQNDKLVDVEKN